MFVGIGYIIILGSVLGGFIAAGGHVAALIQPLEFVMIGGAAAGAFVVANGGAPLKATMKALPTVFKGSPYGKAFYMDLFSLLFEILTKVRKEGLMSIEADVENPEASPV
ncbi:flagellar motor stator protein MotA, partial [Chromobacterium piscinae]